MVPNLSVDYCGERRGFPPSTFWAAETIHREFHKLIPGRYIIVPYYFFNCFFEGSCSLEAGCFWDSLDDLDIGRKSFIYIIVIVVLGANTG